MRISDAERDQVSEVLREAAAEGRITLDELDERLDATYAAKTYADLEPLTADLPGAGGAASAPLPQAPSAVPGVVATPQGQPMVLRGGGESLVRKGEWTVPHRVEAHNKYGSTRLDFREATLSSPVTEVYVDAAWGGAEVILPEGATASVEADASWFGSLRSDVDSMRTPGAPHFVVTGTCQGGSLRVRYKRPFSWGGLAGA